MVVMCLIEKTEWYKSTCEGRRMRKELKDLRDARGATTTQTVEARLGRLQDLHGKGLITDDDFARRKAEILEDL